MTTTKQPAEHAAWYALSAEEAARAMSVDPEPPNKSSTFSPCREEYCKARTANSHGFLARIAAQQAMVTQDPQVAQGASLLHREAPAPRRDRTDRL